MPTGIYKHKPIPESVKKKMSETHKRIGTKPPSCLGRVLSKETKKKIGESNIKACLEGRKRLRFGADNPAWKGGIKPIVLQIRHCSKYVQWRALCFERDNYTCQICQKRGGNLEVDHFPVNFSDIYHENKIKNFEQALMCDKFWDTGNGRTLCRKCHDKTKWQPRDKRTGRFYSLYI